ncbi:MAG: FAD-binding oxidoreductase [Phormidesmis sp.]
MSVIAARLSDVLGADQGFAWSTITPTQQQQIMAALATEQPPSYLALPDTVEKLAQVMALATENGWRVLPMGQGSKLSWGGLAEGIDVVVSTARLNQVIDHAVGDFTVTVEPGLKVADLQRTLAAKGQFLAIDPAFAEQASVGGVVATADTGSLRQRYGGLRDMLIGVAFVRYDGEVAKAGGRVVKNVAGYDLMKLMTGAYGSLGVLSELTFRLYPVQASSRTVVLAGGTDAIGQAATEIRLSGLTPITLDILSEGLAQSLAFSAPPAGQVQLRLVARFQGVAAGVDEQTARLQVIAAVHSLSCQSLEGSADDDFWQRSGDLIKPESVLAKVGMRPSTIPAFLTLLSVAVPGGQARLHGSSGLGWMQLTAQEDLASKLEALRSHCQKNGGFLTLLQAPKSLKQAIEVWGYSGNALGVMREIKQKFDPGRSLSPGRFIGGL